MSANGAAGSRRLPRSPGSRGLPGAAASRGATRRWLAWVGGALLAGAALGVPLTANAADVLTWQAQIAWDSPAGVLNGAPAPGAAYVSLNEASGGHGSQDNTVVTITLTNARFEKLPGGCLTTGVTPVSLGCSAFSG